MKKSLIIGSIFLVLLQSKTSAGVGTTSARFLTIGVGARASGMGEAYTGVAEGGIGAFYNPAGLPYLTKHEITALHMEYLGATKYNYLGYGVSLTKSIGLQTSFILSRTEDEVRTQTQTLYPFHNTDFAANLSLGFKVMDSISLGGTVKWVQQKLYTYKDSTISYDAGLLFTLPFEPHFRVGVAFRNISGDIKFIQEGDPLPEMQVYGVSYISPGRRFTAACDFLKEKGDKKFRENLGAEFWLNDLLCLRAGYRINYDGEKKDALTGGIGFKTENLEIAYAYVPYGDIGTTHRIDSTFRFKTFRPKEEKVIEPTKEKKKVSFLKTFAPEFRGSMGFTYRYIDIDNRKIVNLIPGSAEALELVAIGRSFGTNFSMNLNLGYDNWDKWEAKTIAIEIHRDNLEFNFGDIYPRFTPYTLYNRSMRGVQIDYLFRRKALYRLSPDDIALVTKNQFNLAEFYRLKGRDTRNFNQIDLSVVAGRLARPVGLNERIPFQNGDFATYGVYEQFGYGLRLVTKPTYYTYFNSSLILVEDDENSIADAGTSVKPLKNYVWSIDGRLSSPTGRTELHTELARSLYDNDVRSAFDRKLSDYAGNVVVNHRIKSIKSKLTYERINPDFDDAGNLSIKSIKDREGIYLKQSYVFKEKYNFNYEYKIYHNDLNHKLSYKTNTDELYTNLSFRIGKKLPFFNAGYNYRKDDSNRSKDPTSTIQEVDITNTTFWIGLTQPFAKNSIGVMFINTDYKDKNLYSTTTTRSSFESDGWMLTLSSSQIKNVTAFFTYNSLKIKFTTTKQNSEFYTGNIDYNMFPGKFRLKGEFNIMRINSTSQKEDKDEYGLTAQYYFSSTSTILLKYKYSKDKYIPASSELDYKADIFSVNLQRIF
ncbi:MAG: PorV/PorQ family protein [Candidatus Hydrogenedentota bacterium]